MGRLREWLKAWAQKVDKIRKVVDAFPSSQPAARGLARRSHAKADWLGIRPGFDGKSRMELARSCRLAAIP